MGGDRRWWRRAGQRFHPSLAQSTDLGYEHKWPAHWHLLVTKVQSKYTHTRTHMHTYTHTHINKEITHRNLYKVYKSSNTNGKNTTLRQKSYEQYAVCNMLK